MIKLRTFHYLSIRSIFGVEFLGGHAVSQGSFPCNDQRWANLKIDKLEFFPTSFDTSVVPMFGVTVLMTVGLRDIWKTDRAMGNKLTFKPFLNLFWLAAFRKYDTLACPNVVKASAGEISGAEMISREGRAYHAFFGIPYALPPLDLLRFQPPKPMPELKYRLNATVKPRNCLQNLDPDSSEDCLYLNVFRPVASRKSCFKKPMPVLFYVHGGAYSAGSIGPVNNADYLMDEDVILVSPNYRLGIMGFPSFGNSIMPGNYGLKDLVLALKWVKDNIAAFGGDPDNVTVFGGSAGGAISHILMKSPASENLISRAFSYSGTINLIWSQTHHRSTTHQTLLVAMYVKCCESLESCSVTEKLFNCLQRANGKYLLRGATAVSMGMGGSRILPFAAVIEPEGTPSAVVTEDLSLKPSHKPWMTSITTGESSVFLDISSSLLSNMMAMYLKRHVSLLIYDIVSHSTKNKNEIDLRSQLLENAYFNGSAGFEESYAKMYMDFYFVYPQIFNMKKHIGPKWMSCLEYRGELSMGKLNYPGHADQGIFIFNYRDLRPHVSLNETSEDYNMTKRMIKYLTNFAKYSDPTPRQQQISEAKSGYDKSGRSGASETRWKQFASNEVLRMTGKGDFMGGEEYFKSYERAYELWSRVIGQNYT